MTSARYTIITFAPVQGFIEKSRKLRDLYGSSYILSFLSWIICQAAEAKKLNSVVSPAHPNVTQGMPNQIILKGDFSKEDIEELKDTFYKAWNILVDSCQEWIEKKTIGQNWDYRWWKRDWRLWKRYAWEFFWVQGNEGETITQVRQKINQIKSSRDWIGINWQGESSTLSGTDAIAYPNLGRKVDPREYDYQIEQNTARQFYQQLSQRLGESFIDPREELSIPELIKRLITYEVIVRYIVRRLRQQGIQLSRNDLTAIARELQPKSFKGLNRLKENDTEAPKYWTGWFLGDGDNASKYFQSLSQLGATQEENGLKEFSLEMRDWGLDLKNNQNQYLPAQGRMIYAGGDDFLGVLYYPEQQITPRECLNWFCVFKSKIWNRDLEKKISPSVGFVWAGHQVPQRDVLQHCREAEKSAKSQGRDRIAFRILFNSGNYLEWVCPWWLLDKKEERLKVKHKFLKNKDKLLEKLSHLNPEELQRLIPEKLDNLIESYRDRDGGKNWVHFYQDVANLEARHAFTDKQIDIGLALIEIYFGEEWTQVIGNQKLWWNQYDENERQILTGILGDLKQFEPNFDTNPEYRELLNTNPKVKQALNDWVINLAKVGFYLTDEQ